MDADEFEEAVGKKRIASCVSAQIFASVPFMFMLKPEDMVQFANKENNRSYTIFKTSAGIGKFSYYMGHYAGGLIYCVCNIKQPGVRKMGIVEDLTAWFARHHTTRKFVKGFIIFTIGFLTANQAEILAGMPDWVIVPVGAFLTALANYVQNNTTLPIVGKKAKE